MLPYDTPAPADIGKLMSGELVSPPRLKNPAIPKAISDIVMRAMAPEVGGRYQRAGGPAGRRAGGAAPRRCADGAGEGRADARGRTARDDAQGIQTGCGRGKRRRRASAGSAASRCTRAPIAARSAAKNSRCFWRVRRPEATTRVIRTPEVRGPIRYDWTRWRLRIRC